MKWLDMFRGIAAAIGISIASLLYTLAGGTSHLTFGETLQLALAMVLLSAIRDKPDA